MENKKKLFDYHYFICTNKRANGKASCADKGAESLRAEIKERARTELDCKIRINSSGCLGFCEQGIASVLYPQAEWLNTCEQQDADQILDFLKNNCK